jgi:hypothetical protein
MTVNRQIESSDVTMAPSILVSPASKSTLFPKLLISNMSLRRWNSVSERNKLGRYIINLAELVAGESDDSSSSSSSNEDSDSSTSSDDTVAMVLETTIEYSKFVYQPLVDDSIDFEAPPLLIGDLNEAVSIIDFRFRKQHIQEIADRLWPKLCPLLNGTRDKIKVEILSNCQHELTISIPFIFLCLSPALF